jgi:hypothetical protein
MIDQAAGGPITCGRDYCLFPAEGEMDKEALWLPDIYGKGTLSMRERLAEAGNIRLNSGASPSAQVKARGHMWEFINRAKCYEDRLGHLRESDISVLAGPLSTIHRGVHGVDPYEAYGLDYYGLSHVVACMIRAREDTIAKSPELTSLLQPPLWPMPGRPGVRGAAIIAKGRNVNIERIEYDSRDWNVAWSLLCDAEDALWGSLLHELRWCPEDTFNPFISLMEVYACGLFPVGVKGNELVLYNYTEMKRGPDWYWRPKWGRILGRE